MAGDIFSIDCNADTAAAFRRLNDNSYRNSAMPFKGIRFARSLSDKGFPVDICCDARVAGTIAHPADHSIRIDRDRIVGLYIAECDRVSVSDDRYISFASSSGKCGGSKTFWDKTPTPMKRTLYLQSCVNASRFSDSTEIVSPGSSL